MDYTTNGNGKFLDPELENFYSSYESYVNGNISDFKVWLKSLSGDQVYNFIKWLQDLNLKL